MKTPFSLLLAGVVASSCSIRAADNVILFIGDGMGPQHVRAGRAYVNGNTGSLLQFETLGYSAQEVTTLPDGGIVDSATAGTALATGYQHPTTETISMGANFSIKTTLVELAKARGMRTGIITTDDIGGATPGAFGAHEPDRYLTDAIRADYLLFDTIYNHNPSLPNILLGGGYNDPALVTGTSYSYVGLAQSLGYQYVSTVSELQAATAPNGRLLGLFGGAWAPMTAMAYRPAGSAEPLLSQMLTRSLSLLQNPNGFFMMVEGANIDKLSHSNDRNFVGEVAELNAAVAQAIAWRQNHPADNTLIFVTADHETGALSVPDQAVAPGTIPAMTFGSTGHSAASVPAYATWPAGMQGLTLDNTETFFILEDFLNYSQGGRPPVLTGLAVSGVTASDATVQWSTVEPSGSVVELSGGGKTLTFTTPGRTTDHSVTCAGLAAGTTYALTARSTDLGGFAGTATTSFATIGADPNAYVLADPVVSLGALSGTYQAVITAGDGLKQKVTESANGVGAGMMVEYTLHTPVAAANIDSLTVEGQVSWTFADGQNDALVTEIRVLEPEGNFGWQPISFPFTATPPGNYVDGSGNIVVRFRDSASIRRERKDALSVDYLSGVVVTRAAQPVALSAPSVDAVAAVPVKLTWSQCNLATGYEVWRYPDSGGWAILADLPQNAVSYTDATVSSSTSYNYVVRAYNAGTYADSQPVTVITPGALAAPPTLRISAAQGAVDVTWTGSGVLQKAVAASGPWVTVSNAPNPYRVSTTNLQGYFRIVSGP